MINLYTNNGQVIGWGSQNNTLWWAIDFGWSIHHFIHMQPKGSNYQEPRIKQDTAVQCSKWHYLPADVSWQKTSLRHSVGGTSGCSAAPDPPSPASWTRGGDSCPGMLSYLNTEDRIREALVRHGSKGFYTHAQTNTSWADGDSMPLT